MQLTLIMFSYRDTNRHRGSVQRPWLADWYSRWRLSLSDVDTSCSSLDEQTSLTGSTGVDCQDTITSSHSCRLHTASPCTRSLIKTYTLLPLSLSLLLLLLSAFLWPPYGIGQALEALYGKFWGNKRPVQHISDLHSIFLPCVFFSSFFFFFSSPNLSGRRVDVYHTATHGVALVRI